VLAAVYTLPTGTAVQAQHVLQPRTRQVEHYNTMSGVQIAAKASARGGNAVGYVENGDRIPQAPTGTCGSTARPAAPRGDTRCSSSRSTADVDQPGAEDRHRSSAPGKRPATGQNI
jgi:hypothetical protein